MIYVFIYFYSVCGLIVPQEDMPFNDWVSSHMHFTVN